MVTGTLTTVSGGTIVMSRWLTVPPHGPDPRMDVLVTEPARGPSTGTVLVAHHRDGLDTFTSTICATLATAGFRVAAPDLFSRIDVPGLTPNERKARLRDEEVLRDLVRCRAALPELPTGLLGHCMGGRVALLGAIDLDGLAAAVACYGGSAFRPFGDREPPGPRVGAISCPTMLIGGRHDTNPSPDDLARLAALSATSDHPIEAVIAEDAGHAFMNFTRAETYRPADTQLGLALAIGFLTRHLAAASDDEPEETWASRPSPSPVLT
jgi:dienelactone hydrolase